MSSQIDIHLSIKKTLSECLGFLTVYLSFAEGKLCSVPRMRCHLRWNRTVGRPLRLGIRKLKPTNVFVDENFCTGSLSYRNAIFIAIHLLWSTSTVCLPVIEDSILVLHELLLHNSTSIDLLRTIATVFRSKVPAPAPDRPAAGQAADHRQGEGGPQQRPGLQHGGEEPGDRAAEAAAGGCWVQAGGHRRGPEAHRTGIINTGPLNWESCLAQ